MTQPRSLIVDTSVTCWYHCISRCVRHAYVFAEDKSFHRKEWIDNRLKEPEPFFANSIAGFSIMDNHLHLLIRLDTDIAAAWSPTEVATRWLSLYPPKVNRKAVEPTADMIQQLAANTEWVEAHRARLGSQSWFMECLKEPLSRLADSKTQCLSLFGRFKAPKHATALEPLAQAASAPPTEPSLNLTSLPNPQNHTRSSNIPKISNHRTHRTHGNKSRNFETFTLISNFARTDEARCQALSQHRLATKRSYIISPLAAAHDFLRGRSALNRPYRLFSIVFAPQYASYRVVFSLA